MAQTNEWLAHNETLKLLRKANKRIENLENAIEKIKAEIHEKWKDRICADLNGCCKEIDELIDQAIKECDTDD